MAATETHRDPTFLHLIRDLRDDATALIRQEIALGKREISVKVKGFAVHAALFGAAGLIGLYAVFFLLFSLSNLIQAGVIAAGVSLAIAAWLAPMLMGMVLGSAALLTLLKNLRSMRIKKSAAEAAESAKAARAQWAGERARP